MITVKHLTKRYGHITAVNNISFDIKKGEIVGLLGPNGAGKTTTMKILTGYMPADSGEVTLAGHDVFTDSLEVRKKIGYLPEHSPLYEELNVKEYLEYIAQMHDIPFFNIEKKLYEVLEKAGLQDKLYSEISELSKGYKQRLGLAQALIHNPPILILDEPTTGLDPNQIVEIRHLVKEIGKEKTIILSTHILSEVEATCDRVLIINNGEIVASGTTNELKNQVGAKNHLHVRVSMPKDPKVLLEKIAALKNVTDVKKLPSEERGALSFIVTAEKYSDVRKDVNHILIEMNIDLLEMKREETTLEHAFIHLTKK